MHVPRVPGERAHGSHWTEVCGSKSLFEDAMVKRKIAVLASNLTFQII